jgi:hypothetical protein
MPLPPNITPARPEITLFQKCPPAKTRYHGVGGRAFAGSPAHRMDGLPKGKHSLKIVSDAEDGTLGPVAGDRGGGSRPGGCRSLLTGGARASSRGGARLNQALRAPSPVGAVSLPPHGGARGLKLTRVSHNNTCIQWALSQPSLTQSLALWYPVKHKD